ncbi:MAG: hypothetical protein R6X20_10460 [Phycisphaerae bacterium]
MLLPRSFLATALRLVTITLAGSALAADSVPPLEGDEVPKPPDALWGDDDPAAEPLHAAIVREGDGREKTLGGKWAGGRAFRNLRWVPDGE